jgi:glycosyltransferase involved in cell wall biosynthesis
MVREHRLLKSPRGDRVLLKKTITTRQDTPLKLSVLMLTYNHERFIAQALDSILSQRVNFDYEIVVGDDFSTDNTRDVLARFSLRYGTRIVPLLRDRNIGAMANMIDTFAACRGAYIALLEGDDYWTCDEKLQKQVDFLDSHPRTSLCCHRVELLDADEKAGLGSGIYPRLPPGTHTIDELLQANFVMTCSAVIRRGPIGLLPGWFSGLALGDWPLFALAASHGNIELMDETMAAYRVHSGGMWSSRPAVYRLRETSRMLRSLDRHFEFEYTSIIRRTLAKSYFDLALIEREMGNRARTGKELLNCIWNGGWRLSRRQILGLAGYTVMGSWYKKFSKARAATEN